ncbi:MAG: 50S ribosomal protein L11 methyltransferase [Gammaproteobacteria bacterium]|nr:50S ribosomal protein L11 methyltransferase [Gammaproteobacteria bacterium]
MAWLRLRLEVDGARVAELESRLQDLGAESISLSDAGNETLIELTPGESIGWRRATVLALFADVQSTQPLRELAQEFSAEAELDSLPDQDWERAWMERFRARPVCERLWIVPGWNPDGAPAGVASLLLDPGLAFGSGEHPTTRLCLEWLCQQQLHDQELIDYGCGSGVLALAALKLGARAAVGVDNDARALAASTENARRNGLQGRFRASSPGAAELRPAHIVIANIVAGTLLDLRDSLLALTRPGGRLLLTGLLTDQADSVATAYAPQISLQSRSSAEWVLLHGTRPGDATGD